MASFEPHTAAARMGLALVDGSQRSCAVDATIGFRIRMLRTQALMGAERVGAETGIGAARLREIEAGAVRPRAAEVCHIASCLGVTFAEIFVDFT